MTPTEFERQGLLYARMRGMILDMIRMTRVELPHQESKLMLKELRKELAQLRAQREKQRRVHHEHRGQ